MKKIVGIILSIVLLLFIIYNNFLYKINFNKIISLKVFYEINQFRKKEKINIVNPIYLRSAQKISVFDSNLTSIKIIELNNIKFGKSFIAQFTNDQNKINFYDKKYQNLSEIIFKENVYISPETDVFVELSRNLMEVSIYRYNVFSFYPEPIIKYSSDSIILSFSFNDNLVTLSLFNGRNVFIDLLNKKIYEKKKGGISIASNISLYGDYSIFVNMYDKRKVIYIYDVSKGIEISKEFDSEGSDCKIFCVYDDYFLYSDNKNIIVFQLQNNNLIEKNRIKSNIKVVDLKWEDKYAFGVGIQENKYFLIIYDREMNKFSFIKWLNNIEYLEIIENANYLYICGEERFWIFKIE
ncbi:MAG: hypothetical protein N3A58_04205 [Spirochaetes bacterium]|nr:hypothetical protein [Spirochaetota bacterium]